MKRLSAVLAVLFFTSACLAQGDAGKYIPNNSHGARFKRTASDSVAVMPLATSPHIPYRAGGFRYNTSDETLELWNGSLWKKVQGGASGPDSNFANADLIFTGHRSHFLGAYSLTLTDVSGNVFSMSSTGLELDMAKIKATTDSFNIAGKLFVSGNIATTNGVEILRITPGTEATISQVGNNSILFNTNSTTRVRILGNGRVGIGNHIPLEALDVDGNIQTNDAFILNAGGVLGEVGIGGSLVFFRTITNHGLQFRTNDIERIRITPAGKIGIGISAPDGLLHVNGTGIFADTLRATTMGNADSSDRVASTAFVHRKLSTLRDSTTASNVGAGLNIFKQKSGTDLQFKTLAFPNSVQGTANTDDVSIQLSGDQSTPGVDKIYGTDYSGAKGWQDPDVGWYNIRKAGADPTGATDVSSYIIAAMAAGKRFIYIPSGRYLISSQIQMKDSVTIKGDGRQNTILLLTSNITAFKSGLGNGGMSCQYLDFGFLGTKTLGADTTQSGIVTDSLQKVYINNVGGYNLGGWFANIRTSYYNFNLPMGVKGGAMISNCYVDSCYGGVRFNVLAEYSSLENSTMVNCTFGIFVNAGSCRITNNNASYNICNLVLGGGTNNGHGSATNNTFNHAGYANVYAIGCDQGFSLSNNMIYGGTGSPNFGRIVLINSHLVHFEGGDIAVDSIIMNNAISTWFSSVRFKHDRVPKWSITGSYPTIFNCGISGVATFSSEPGISVVSIQPPSAVSGGVMHGYVYGNPTAADQRLLSIIAGSNPSVLTLRQGAKIEAFSEAAWTDGSSQPTYLNWSTVGSGSITMTERMRLTSSGNLAVGTSNPGGRKLYINGSIGANKDSIPKQATIGPRQMLTMDTTTGKFERMDIPVWDAGEYTPTLTNVSNLTGSTAYICQFTRIGNIVRVEGKVSVDPTTTGTVHLGISLPFSSNFTVIENLNGHGSGSLGVERPTGIEADVTNDRADLFFTATASELDAGAIYFTFTYKIL